MDLCRICLTSEPQKDIFQLQTVINEDTKSFVDVFMFCLDIQVVKDTKISTKLCLKCYNKVLSFHEFKCLALKNDAYLKSIQEDVDVKNEVHPIDHIKTELVSLSDESQDHSVKDEPKEELCFQNGDSTHELESEDEFLSVIKKLKYEYVENETKENAPHKRRKTKSTSKVDVTNIKQICEECGKSVKDLKAHSYVHLPKACRKRLKCKNCDKTFSSHSARYKHNRIKHLGIRHKCNSCNQVVTNLRHHRLMVHDRESLPYGCVPCGRRFISQSSLDVHMTTHTKDRSFACPECPKKFTTKLNMQNHKRQVHDKEMSHMCQLCSKRFFKKYHLQMHLRIHSKEKPYECSVCGKFFSTTTQLRSHQLIHEEVKAFSCTLCEMSFKKKSYLTVHMISHTKEKRHPCQYCGMRFGRSDHRKRHEHTAHEKHFVTSSPSTEKPDDKVTLFSDL